jgi:transcriptional regulator with XRE-family HTH domain
MPTQGYASFSQALRAALSAAGMPQAVLARELSIDQGQVSRWVNGKALPQVETVRRIEETLGVDLSGDLAKATPAYELFVSSPISGMSSEAIPEHQAAVAKVVAAASPHVNGLFWPGKIVTTAADRQMIAPDIATERAITALHGCSALLYLQFAEIVGPSSALVELGFALGAKMNITIMLKKGLTSPYMLRGFGAVAAKLKFLPEARIYTEIESADEAASLIASNGRELLGLT